MPIVRKIEKKIIGFKKKLAILLHFHLLLSFVPATLLKASFEGNNKMYLANELMYDCFNKEEFNNFQFWREPVMELTLDDFELCEVDVKDEPFISTQYDSFLYWRDPIPDLEEL